MCNARFLRTQWYDIVARISSLITDGGQAFWHELFFANLFLNALTHFFPPESHLVKFLIGPTNQSLLIWVWAESDVFPYFCQLSLIKSFFALQPLWVESSVVWDKLSPQATWTLSNSWEWGAPFDWVYLDSSIMPLLKICQDLKWEKRNLSTKNFHCWFNSTMVILWIVMSVFNYYSPILLFLFFSFFFVQGKLCKETGTKYPTDVYQKAEDVGIYIKVWSVFTKYWE